MTYHTSAIDSVIFAVGDTSRPIKPGFFRVWFNDHIGTGSGWREIPVSREKEARDFYWCQGNETYEKDGQTWQNPLYQEFDFSMVQR